MSTDTTEQETNISFDWQRGFAAGINACEDYLLSQMVSGGLLNDDYSGAAILDPEQSEKARRLLLKIARKIIVERAAAALHVGKECSDGKSAAQQRNSPKYKP